MKHLTLNKYEDDFSFNLVCCRCGGSSWLVPTLSLENGERILTLEFKCLCGNRYKVIRKLK